MSGQTTGQKEGGNLTYFIFTMELLLFLDKKEKKRAESRMMGNSCSISLSQLVNHEVIMHLLCARYLLYTIGRAGKLTSGWDRCRPYSRRCHMWTRGQIQGQIILEFSGKGAFLLILLNTCCVLGPGPGTRGKGGDARGLREELVLEMRQVRWVEFRDV